MKILIVSQGHYSTDRGVNISGGEVRWIEIAKTWKSLGNDLHVYTNQSGKDLCIKFGLNINFHLQNDIKIKSVTQKSLIMAINSVFRFPRSLRDLQPDLIYSVSTDYFDIGPAFMLKIKNKCPWAVVVHWIAPLNRRGKLTTNLLYYLQQRFGLFFTKKYSDTILAVSPSTKNELIKLGFPKSKVEAVECGVDYYGIDTILKKYENAPKIYDAVFMKRFHSAKGVYDLIDIWKKVVDSKPDAKLILIGDGPTEIVNDLKRLISINNLQNNVDFAGLIYNFELKIKLLRQSKMFLLPTYEENWAIVIGEALTCGLPVICYELPEIKPIWGDTVFWIKLGDTQNFANTIIQLLDSEEERVRIYEYVRSFTLRYNWPELSERELSLSTTKSNIN